jgi:hypothetical protein
MIVLVVMMNKKEKGSKERKEEKKEGRKEGWKEEIETKENNF